MALPFLRAFTATLVGFVNLHTKYGWDHQLALPLELRIQLKEIKYFFEVARQAFCVDPSAMFALRQFRFGLGGVHTLKKVCPGFLEELSPKHVNTKELLAAISTVKSLAKPQSHVRLSMDNTTAYYYLKKDGRKFSQYNQILRPFLSWLMQNQAKLSLEWVPSQDQQTDSSVDDVWIQGMKSFIPGSSGG